MPISAIDTVTFAFEHTKRQLLQPFRFGQWARLAIVGLLAGELGSGGFNFHSGFPHSTRPSHHFLQQGWPAVDPAILGGLIAVLTITGFVFLIVMLYINSVMRFVLFDSVVAKECHIRQGWSRRQNPGWKLFLWQLALMLATLGGLAVVVGIPAAFAFGMGWFHPASEHVLPLVLFGIVVFFVLILFIVMIAVVHVLTKDFVVPQMALENIGAIEGWRRLWPMLRTEKGPYAGYVGLKIVLAIAAGILIGIASLILGLMVAVPTAIMTVIALVTGKNAGLTWNVYTITVAVVVGCIVLAIFLYLVSLLAVPAIVFFPAYAIYFFAARYRPLSVVLYPSAPLQEPPPTWPLPQPAG